MIVTEDAAQREVMLSTFRDLAGWPHDLSGARDDERALFATADLATFPGAILPARQNGGLVYYALAHDGAAWRALSPLLRAFVGPTVTDFVGRTMSLNNDDPLEAWLATTGLLVARLTPGGGNRRTVARALLQRLPDLVARAEGSGRVVPRSTDQVLRSFDLALVAGNRVDAEAQIAYLRQHHRLDALNLYFLEAQVDATLGAWAMLRGRRFFRDLCHTRRPPGITAALAEALFWTTVQPAAQADGERAALDLFRRQIHGQVGTLLDVPPPWPSRPVATMFLLAAMMGDEPDRAAVEQLRAVALSWPPDEQVAFSVWLDLVPAGPSPDTIDPAGPSPEPEAVTARPGATTDAGLVDPPIIPAPASMRSWATTLLDLQAIGDDAGPATVELAGAAVLGAVNIDSLDAYAIASGYVGRLSAVDRDRLLSQRLIERHWTDIQERLTDGRVPRNWHEWLDLLPSMSVRQARDWAERAVTEWPIERQLTTAADAARLAEAFERAGGTVADVARAREIEQLRDQLLPNVIGWTQRDPDWPNLAYLDLYHRLFDLLAMSGLRSESSLDALRNLLHGMLSIGVTRRQYIDLLGTVRDVVTDLSGGDYLDYLVDVLEVTADAACPDPPVRRDLWETALGILAQFVARLSDLRQILLRELAAMLGLQDLLAPQMLAGPSSPAARIPLPRRIQVALYTLTESVGRRVKEQIEGRYDGLTITVDSSHDRTPQLVNLARHTDLFVVCWRSAKHAATDVIGAERPPTRPTRYALGKGSSSIMSLLTREIDALTAELAG